MIRVPKRKRGDKVYVIWQNRSAEWVPYGPQVMMSRSDDRSASFGNPLVIVGDTGDSPGFHGIKVVAKNDFVSVSWPDRENLESPADVMLLRGKVGPVDT